MFPRYCTLMDQSTVCFEEKVNSALHAYDSMNKDEAETSITSIDGIALQVLKRQQWGSYVMCSTDPVFRGR